MSRGASFLQQMIIKLLAARGKKSFMKIMTQEYCERCPWFNHSLGYIEDPDYWESHKCGCACQDCTYRQECEAKGPKDVSTCSIIFLDKLKAMILEKHSEICEAKGYRDLSTCSIIALDRAKATILEKHPEILEKLKRSEAERYGG